MAAVDLTNITPPRVPLTDSRTGLISREWYRFFLNLFMLTGEGRNTTSLTDLQLGPPPAQQENFSDIIADVEGALSQPAQAGVVEQVAELQKQVQALEVATDQTALLAQIDELQKQVQALQVTPPPREFKRARYGQFYDTTVQIPAAINTPYGITFNTTDVSNGVYLGTPASRVYVDEPAIYNFLFSIQLDKTSGGTANFWVWARINGVDVPDSTSQVQIQGNDAEQLVTVGYFFDLDAGDYVEIMYAVSDVSVQVQSFPASAFYPAIPSIILTVSNNIEGVQ
jgi:hypothetical protein